MTRERPSPDPDVGLCCVCRHAALQRSARGSAFWRCRRADTDPAFRRYPPLPVTHCAGFEAADAGRGPLDSGV